MKNILKYFDLNDRTNKAREKEPMQNYSFAEYSVLNNGDSFLEEESEEGLNRTTEHRDLSSQIAMLPHQKLISVSEQLILYLGLLLGIIVSFVIDDYKNKNPIDLSFLTGAYFAVSLVVALIVAPKAYETLGVNPKGPFLSRFGLFVQEGILWQTLISPLG